jgi:hypothetical protein
MLGGVVIMAKTNKNVTITLKGDKKAIEGFMEWLDGQGEQDYWTWMECREEPTTLTRFDYDFSKGEIKAEVGKSEEGILE